MPTVAFRVVRSRRAFIKAPDVLRELERTLDTQVKPHFIREFDKVVADWKHRVTFRARKRITQDAIKVTVFPTGDNKDIYRYVTGGTRPHVIRAKNAHMLAFMWGVPGSYVPKTRPIGKYGGPGVVVGGSLHRFKQVQHPGTKARNFEKAIREQQASWFTRTMENSWRRAIRNLNK